MVATWSERVPEALGSPIGVDCRPVARATSASAGRLSRQFASTGWQRLACQHRARIRLREASAQGQAASEQVFRRPAQRLVRHGVLRGCGRRESFAMVSREPRRSSNLLVDEALTSRKLYDAYHPEGKKAWPCPTVSPEAASSSPSAPIAWRSKAGSGTARAARRRACGRAARRTLRGRPRARRRRGSRSGRAPSASGPRSPGRATRRRRRRPPARRRTRRRCPPGPRSALFGSTLPFSSIDISCFEAHRPAKSTRP